MSTSAELFSPAAVFQAEVKSLGALDNLGAHLVQCMPARRGMHRLRGIFEAMHQFFMPRLVSSVAGVGVSAALLVYLVS